MTICKRTYVILGIGRSSTSLVSRALLKELGEGSFGCTPDDLSEDQEFLNLNTDILAEAGGSWDTPPSENMILSVGRSSIYKERIENLVNHRNERFELWGWKDPRTTLTIRCYMPWLIGPHFITCWRKPHDVSLSLIRAGHFHSYTYGVMLAQEYNRRLLSFLQEYHT